MNLKHLIQPAYRKLIAKKGTQVKELEWTLRYLRKKETNTTREPTRLVLAEKIAEAKPQTVLEIGCGYGQNILLISEKLPQTEIHGLDSNRTAIKYAKKKSPRAKLQAAKAEECLKDYPDKSMDVTFTNAVLMYISPKEIAAVIREIIRITRKKIVLVELQPENPEDDPLGRGRYENGKWTRNYIPHLKGLAVKLTPIPKESNLDEGWKKKGVIIEAIT